MDPTSEARNIAKEQYTQVRRSLTEFEERFIASRWDEDALVRTGFDRFLGSLDRVAGWLFPEGDQSPRAQEEAGEPDIADAHDEAGEKAWADEVRTAEPETARDVWEQAAADEAAMAAQAHTDDAATAAQAHTDEPEAPARTQSYEPAMAEQVQVGTLDVAFTLPADVEAISVALCGDFNNWSEHDIYLSRDTDGTWRTTVALEPGRAYRYRFLLDGERWENDRHADDYAPNPFGTVDSVVVVGRRG